MNVCEGVFCSLRLSTEYRYVWNSGPSGVCVALNVPPLHVKPSGPAQVSAVDPNDCPRGLGWVPLGFVSH